MENYLVCWGYVKKRGNIWFGGFWYYYVWVMMFYTIILFNKFQQASSGVKMSKPKQRRVNYRINYCSSEDPEYPVSQLVLQSAESKGWQTKRFAPFPQTLIIELLELTVVTNLSFLSHQTKICTKIEIQGKEDHDQNWSRLGYTTLESGINTNYQSRQLRNINLGGKIILLLKFTFHQNYANHVNVFNQIGIIALLVYGEKATVEKEMLRDKQGTAIANLSDLDRETILKLKNLQQCKKQAAQNHKFQEAKDYKQQIQTLQSNLKALMVLQKQKKQAIKRQEYDVAKQIVQRMKRLRGPMFIPPKSSNNNSLHNYNIMTPKKSVHSSMDNYSNNDDPQIQNNSMHHYKIPSRQSEPRNNKSFDLNLKKNASITPFDQIKIKSNDKYPIQEQLSKNQNYSERKKNMLPPRISKPNRKSIQEEEPEEEENSPATQLPSVKKLEKLTPQQFDQCSRYFPIFNQVTFEYLLSREHTYREKGIDIINQSLKSVSTDDKKYGQEFVAASIFVVRKLIDDKIINVLILAMDYFGMLMKKLRPGPIGSVSKHVQHILMKMSDFLGHNNQKCKETCEDVFIALPYYPLTNKDLCYEILCDYYKQTIKQKTPKITIGRLNMLAQMVVKFKMGKCQDLIIEFCKRFLEDKNSDIRTAAVALMVKISREVGYQNLYDDLQYLKPQVIRMIEEKIEQEGGVIEKVIVEKPKNANNSTQKLQKVEKSTKNPTPQKKNLPPQNPEYYCDYCKQFDKRFQDDNFRDKHLYSSCPMINLCKECSQAIEVSNMNNHLLSECEQHKFYKRCAKCKEAIPSREFNNHTKMKECLSAKAPSAANRCPLCHEDIEAGEKGWIKHLVHEKCPNNSR